MHLKISYTAIFILHYTIFFGQGILDIRFQSLDVSDGLPNNTINDIIRDHYGFLWVATNEGLCRYDSPHNIKVFDNHQFGLASNQISSLYAGTDNDIWIGSRLGGLSRYNFIDKSYTSYTAENGAITNNDINSIYEDDNARIWVGTEKGLNIFNKNTESWNTDASNPLSTTNLNNKAILGISGDSKGWTWIGTWGGGLYLALNSGDETDSTMTFRKFIPSENPNSLNVWRVFEDSQGRYWVATHNAGLFLMEIPAYASNDADNQNWEPNFHNYTGTLIDKTNLTSNYIYDVNEDKEGNIWLACIHGLNVITAAQLKSVQAGHVTDHKPALQFINILYNKNLKGSINNPHLNKIYSDSTGMMWFGSASGVNMFMHGNSRFKIFDLTRYDEDLFNSNVSALASDYNNNIWIASETNGLLLFDKTKNLVVNAKKDINSQLPNHVFSMKTIGDTLLLGTDNGFGLYDIKKNRYRKYSVPKHKLNNIPVIYSRSVFMDSQHRIWLGTERGLILFNSDYSFNEIFRTNNEDSLSISDNSITDIHEDSKHQIWISTYNGLNRLKETGNKFSFTQIKTGGQDCQYNISSNQMSSIDEYNDIIYLGSNNGISYYDMNLDKFSLLTEVNKNNNIFNIDITDDGQLWAVNSDGLLKYDIQNKSVTHFEKEEALGDLANQFNSSFITKEGKLLFALRDGFGITEPDNFDTTQKFLPVYFTEATLLSNKEKQVISLLNKDKIDVPSRVFQITFNYAALNYNHPRDNLYAYKLEGFEDDEWQYSNHNSPITLTNLDPGEYKLTIKASNNEGVWNEKGMSLTLNVIPAFYETAIFKIISVLLSLLLLNLAIKYYLRNILMRNEQLKQEISDRKMAEASLLERDIKMKILVSELDKTNSDLERSNKDLEQFAYIASHDLKEPLRTIGTFTDLLKYKFEANLNESGKKYIYFITDGVHRMSSLINSLLTYSRAGQEYKEMEKVKLSDLVSDVLNDLSIVIKEKIATVDTANLPAIYCNRDQISMLFSNLILNGIKFNTSNQPRISISFAEMEEHWQFTVSDNGIGISKEYQEQIFEIFKRLHSKQEFEGTGIGLALSKRIVESHAGRIWLESTPGHGSSFHFTIAKVIDSIISDKRKQKKKKLKEDIESVLNS